MNLCIVLGKIVSTIEFKFIIKGKNKSIVYFDLLLLNKSVVRVKAYNEMADYIYRKLKLGQFIIIEGKLREDGTVECGSFKMINENYNRKNKLNKKY